MYAELDNRKYYLDKSFSHKVSELRKKSSLKVETNLYIQEDEVENKDLTFFDNLKSLPDFLYFGNTYYFWIFETANLEKVNIVEDKYYRESVSRFFGIYRQAQQRKFTVSIEFTYKQVWGTNNRVMFDRDLLLRGILD